MQKSYCVGKSFGSFRRQTTDLWCCFFFWISCVLTKFKPNYSATDREAFPVYFGVQPDVSILLLDWSKIRDLNGLQNTSNVLWNQERDPVDDSGWVYKDGLVYPSSFDTARMSMLQACKMSEQCDFLSFAGKKKSEPINDEVVHFLAPIDR